MFHIVTKTNYSQKKKNHLPSKCYLKIPIAKVCITIIIINVLKFSHSLYLNLFSN